MIFELFHIMLFACNGNFLRQQQVICIVINKVSAKIFTHVKNDN